MNETRIGHFRITREIGQGGMAVVYLAQNEKLRRTVALKVLRAQFAADEEFVRLFIEEAMKAARLQHPHIITIFSADTAGGRHYIEMELLHGKNLKEIIKERGALPVWECVNIVLKVCDALEYACTEGGIIAHRDIKPQNIMICRRAKRENVPILTDFGIARAREDTGLFRTGTIIGTPEYMSPEQAEGGKLDARSDIYSLGVVMYEMATGQVPFRGETPFSTALMHVKEIPRPPGEINPVTPKWLESVILRCMSKDPAHRYPDVAAMMADLRNMAGGVAPEDTGVAVAPEAAAAASPLDSQLEKLIVMEEEDAGEGDRAESRKRDKSAGSLESLRARGPLLFVDRTMLKLPARGRAHLKVGNRGSAPLKGVVRPSVPWIRVSAPQFSLGPGETLDVELRVARLPSVDHLSGFLDVETNGGCRRVPAHVETIGVIDRARALAAACSAAAAVLAGAYLFMWIRNAGGGGNAAFAGAAALAAAGALAVLMRNRWLPAAGIAAMCAAAWSAFDLTSDPAASALALAFVLVPFLVTLAASGALFRRFPSAAFSAAALPLLLWSAGLIALGAALGGGVVPAFRGAPPAALAIRETRHEKTGGGAPAGEVKRMITITAERANVRRGAGTNHPVIGTARRGETFEKTGESGNWHSIKYHGVAAWVSKSVGEEYRTVREQRGGE
ncbi:MAG: protein kinase [bacterium]